MEELLLSDITFLPPTLLSLHIDFYRYEHLSLPLKHLSFNTMERDLRNNQI